MQYGAAHFCLKFSVLCVQQVPDVLLSDHLTAWTFYGNYGASGISGHRASDPWRNPPVGAFGRVRGGGGKRSGYYLVKRSVPKRGTAQGKICGRSLYASPGVKG